MIMRDMKWVWKSYELETKRKQGNEQLESNLLYDSDNEDDSVLSDVPSIYSAAVDELMGYTSSIDHKGGNKQL